MPNYHRSQTTKNRDAIAPILPKFISEVSIRSSPVASVFAEEPPWGAPCPFAGDY